MAMSAAYGEIEMEKGMLDELLLISENIGVREAESASADDAARAAFVRGEDPMRPDIEDVVTRALLLETPDIDAAALRIKVAKYFLGKFFWLQNKPGPFDRGPLTLLQYLRVALHNGGFPGLHGNAAFEPLRRELVEGLEPF